MTNPLLASYSKGKKYKCSDVDSFQQGPYVVDEMNKFTRTTEVLWRKRDSMTTLWVREHTNPCLDRLLLLFWEHYIKESLHSSLLGSNDQTIDNIRRTLRAYSESGSVSQRAIKLWETNSFYAWTLIRKSRTFLGKQVSQDFMHSFLGLITPGNCPFLPRTAPPSGIVSGLSQVGEVRQPRDWETSYRPNEDSGYVKAKGWGSITPF